MPSVVPGGTDDPDASAGESVDDPDADPDDDPDDDVGPDESPGDEDDAPDADGDELEAPEPPGTAAELDDTPRLTDVPADGAELCPCDALGNDAASDAGADFERNA